MLHVEILAAVACFLVVAALGAALVLALRRGARAAALARQQTTDLRVAQLDLAQAEKLASVGLIAAGVAHEINNPASYVLANLTVLRESLGDLRAQRLALLNPTLNLRTEFPSARELDARDRVADEALRDALDGLLRIRDIVADLRSVAQKDAREPEPVRLAKVVETSVALALPTVRGRASIELSLERVPLVLGHAGKLSQVVINLIVNAGEAIPDETPHLGRIVVRTHATEGEITLEVRDNGRGIPAGQLGEIFRPHYTTKRAGTGLGLAICRRIVEEHGGRIEVESILGEGTTFRVVLPKLPTPDGAGLPELETGPHGALVPIETTRVAARRAAARVRNDDERRLLMIVDDEALLLKVLARFLGRTHRVIAAGSVDEALRLIHEGAVPELVLCDLMMPVRSGAELYLALERERPALAARITFMSGGGTDQQLNNFPHTVGRPTLEKPLEPHALLAYIDAQLATPRDE